MQTILVYLIFSVALIYAGWRAYKSITHKEKAGCSKCEGAGISSPVSVHKKD